ncbi:hypothetical protein K504DRAFT_449814 [Pleomassaria siparia CBS 279.74]|uniref:Protein-lysine N-methyltransferase EFM4 n=1 Tax=Pleomassaria siparia CBS 279.74 TaxID=1314801 RepID=A0A6G1KJT4_9PLEO|nr:hypothetical protein K504DRAFT_449814 [Pleomassaria siparia CBS 279.74]
MGLRHSLHVVPRVPSSGTRKASRTSRSPVKIGPSIPPSLTIPIPIPVPVPIPEALPGFLQFLGYPNSKASIPDLSHPRTAAVFQMTPPLPEHLEPSELGNKSYWDTAYTQELANYTSNTTTEDEGTIWFSDAGAEERMLQFLENLSDEGILRKDDEEVDETEGKQEEEEGEEKHERSAKATRFLDLGTGNGHLLFALREDEWNGEMLGVDYSAQSVKLAKEICARKDDSYHDIQFQEWDLLSSPPGSWLGSGFDVVLDKGTFDAICLSQETDAQGRRICEGYREKVEVLVKKKGGRFLITSCNWTEEELRGWFEGGGSELVYEDKVKYPSFTFGGKTGSKVVTLCFKRG